MTQQEKKNLYLVAWRLVWKYDYWTPQQAMAWCLKVERQKNG